MHFLLSAPGPPRWPAGFRWPGPGRQPARCTGILSLHCARRSRGLCGSGTGERAACSLAPHSICGVSPGPAGSTESRACGTEMGKRRTAPFGAQPRAQRANPARRSGIFSFHCARPSRTLCGSGTGEVAEWSIAPHSKCGVSQGTVGSNPTLSATKALEKEALSFPDNGFAS